MKKVIGIIFLALGAFFGLGVLTQLPEFTAAIARTFSGGAHDIGYMMGTMLGLGILTCCSYFLIKYGANWVRTPVPPKPSTNVLDEDLMTNNRNGNQQI
jgi:hypothetical protein